MLRQRTADTHRWLAGAGLLALALGCSINPATGNRQLMLLSEADEIAIGRQNDEQIVAALGLYPDAGIQEWVATMGRAMAARSERPNLPWTFRVLDDPVVNAFALPGGFVYVTRGILAHLGSEAELAAVVGHEIGHVTARHGASRMSKAQLAGIGLAVGSAVSDEVAAIGDLAQTGLGLLFLKYSRDDERQADDLGLRYSIRTGYDAREMPRVFRTLKRVSESGGGGRLPSWLATHPDPEAREERIEQALAGGGVDFAGTRIARQEYLRRLDGLVYGADPRQGFFRGAVFYHPEMAFRVEFPAGWNLRNQRLSVDGTSPGRDAAVQLSLAAEAEPWAAAERFAEQEGLEPGRIRRVTMGGLPGAALDFEATAGERELRGRAAFVRDGEATLQLLGYSTAAAWGERQEAVGGFVGSYRKVRDRAILELQPARLEIVELREPLTLDRFQVRYPSSVPLAEVALINQVAADGLVGGHGAKRVVGGPGAEP